MRLLPRLPRLKVGRGVTQQQIQIHREMNSAIRYRCPVQGCPRVAAVVVEQPDLVDILREHPGISRKKFLKLSGMSGNSFRQQVKDEIGTGSIRAERQFHRVRYYAA